MRITYDFSAKTAVVTGGANGIGRAIAERFASSGGRVWVWDVAPAHLANIDSLSVDVTNPNHVASALAKVLDRDSRVDILVNNAGYLGSFVPFDLVPADEWRRVVDVNLIGALEVSYQVIPHMRSAGGGRIVNMGSLAGKEGLPNLAAYSAASAGVIAFTKALAKDLATANVRVNCVAPAPISTDLIKRLGPAVVESMIAVR